MKEIEDSTDKCKDIQCSRIRRINLVKMTMLPKAIYRFITLSIKRAMTFFTGLEQTILKILRGTTKDLK